MPNTGALHLDEDTLLDHGALVDAHGAASRTALVTAAMFNGSP